VKKTGGPGFGMDGIGEERGRNGAISSSRVLIGFGNAPRHEFGARRGRQHEGEVEHGVVLAGMRDEGMRMSFFLLFCCRRGTWASVGLRLGPCWWASAGLLRGKVQVSLFSSPFLFLFLFLVFNSGFNSNLNSCLFCRFLTIWFS
jgi:hypothetical protein